MKVMIDYKHERSWRPVRSPETGHSLASLILWGVAYTAAGCVVVCYGVLFSGFFGG